MTIGVTIVPGQMALQRIPVPAKRIAVWRVSPITAALEETYAAPPQPIRPATEATLTIEPVPTFAISALTSRIQYMVPFVLVPRMRSISSSSTLSIGRRPFSRIPALLTRTSIFPKASIAFATRFFTSSTFEMSVTTGRTVPPASLICAATSSSGSARLALMTTLAPSLAKRRAVALPTPEFPPVMIAVFPSKRPIRLPPVI